jgi:predicted porin
MQKKLIAVAVAGALGAPALALAQNATVNIYGRFYAEYAKVNQGNQNVAPFNSGLVDVDILQAPGSAIGFRGEEKLGGGMSAWFQCESSYDFRGQNQDGLCARNSALGLKGGFGNFFVGVWDTPFKRVQDSVGGNDTGVFGTAFLLMGNSTTTASGVSNQAVFKRRQVNSINYDTPNFGGFQASGTYTNLNTQTNVVNSSTGSKPRVWSLSAKYANGPINVYGAYEKHNDIVAGTTQDDKGYVLGATYTFANQLKIGGIYSQQKFQTGIGAEGKVHTWHLGIDWKISGPHGVRASYTAAGDVKGNSTAVGTTRPAAGADTSAALWQIRYVHALSKRTEFTAGYVKVKNDSNARYQLGGLNSNAPGNDPSAFAIALDHRF